MKNRNDDGDKNEDCFRGPGVLDAEAETATIIIKFRDQENHLIISGVEAIVQLMPHEPHFYLHGPGFKVKVMRIDPAAHYPGKPTN